MDLLNLTLPDLVANLALDEALLNAAEAGTGAAETLRLWESRQPAVILGRSSVLEVEVDVDYCRKNGISVLRRPSGGAAVVIGPGCLMYSVVLSLKERPALRSLEESHAQVLDQVRAAVARLGVELERKGTSDLVLGKRKVSGNSLRVKRDHLLYHGTLLYDFPLDNVSRTLRTPPRMPEYRDGRSHADFVTNLSLSARDLRGALREQWQPDRVIQAWPEEELQELLEGKYSEAKWRLL